MLWDMIEYGYSKQHPETPGESESIMAETVIKASDIVPGKAGRSRGEKNPLGRIPALAPKSVLETMRENGGTVEFSDSALFDTLKSHVEATEGVRLSEAKREGVTPEIAFDMFRPRLIMGLRQAAAAQQAGQVFTKVQTDADSGHRTLVLSLAPIVADTAE